MYLGIFDSKTLNHFVLFRFFFFQFKKMKDQVKIKYKYDFHKSLKTKKFDLLSV